MKKSIYEQLGGTYREENGYFLPDIELPPQKTIGKYGKIHLEYIKNHRKSKYNSLLVTFELNDYLYNINEQAEEMFLSLIEELAKAQKVDEKLKANNQMLWVQQMNNIRRSAAEIVMKELIFI